MTEFVALRPKTYSYLADDNDKKKQAEGTKNVLQNVNLNLEIVNIA